MGGAAPVTVRQSPPALPAVAISFRTEELITEAWRGRRSEASKTAQSRQRETLRKTMLMRGAGCKACITSQEATGNSNRGC